MTSAAIIVVSPEITDATQFLDVVAARLSGRITDRHVGVIGAALLVAVAGAIVIVQRRRGYSEGFVDGTVGRPRARPFRLRRKR